MKGLVAIWFLATIGLASCTSPERPRPEIVIVGPATHFAWPIYIAQEAGYYEKYGLSVRLVSANHPADVAMLTSGTAQVSLNTLQRAMELATKYSRLVVVGSPLRKWLFSLVASPDIRQIQDLKGRRIGVTQIGGATYQYAVRLLNRSGVRANEVRWVPLGDASRGAALAGGQVDATMLSAPAYFALEAAGFNSLANIHNDDEVHATNVLLLTRKTVADNPRLPAQLVMAHAEAVRRFYEDPEFAVKSFLEYDKQDLEGLRRVYSVYSRSQALAAIPYITAADIQYNLQSEEDARLAEQMRNFDYSKVIDNATVEGLLRGGFFNLVFSEAHQLRVGPRLRISEGAQ